MLPEGSPPMSLAELEAIPMLAEDNGPLAIDPATDEAVLEIPTRPRKTSVTTSFLANGTQALLAMRRRGKSNPCLYEHNDSTELPPDFHRGRSGTVPGLLSAPVVQPPPPPPVIKRRVTFRTTLYPDYMPTPKHQIASYDELFFNVAGLYQTVSFLHDPPSRSYYTVEDPNTTMESSSTTSSTSSSGLNFDSPPLERSMELMIAEFLYRSAIYLGFKVDTKPWVMGFRENKRFSTNDVKRWRRLAHHDWAREEENQESVSIARRRNKSTSSVNAMRDAVRNWVQRAQLRRNSSPPLTMSALECPPPVPIDTDLSHLVVIANSCISFGAFRLKANDILTLSNIDIASFK